MRHALGYRKLNKTSEHRKALFKNMLNSLIKYEQIITTLPKATELKPQIDKVITLGKRNKLSCKKKLFSELQDEKSVKKVFLNSQILMVCHLDFQKFFHLSFLFFQQLLLPLVFL